MSNSAIPWTVACQAPLFGDFPGKNTGVGCCFLLQGIFLTQGSNPGLPHCRRILYCQSHQDFTLNKKVEKRILSATTIYHCFSLESKFFERLVNNCFLQIFYSFLISSSHTFISCFLQIFYSFLIPSSHTFISITSQNN